MQTSSGCFWALREDAYEHIGTPGAVETKGSEVQMGSNPDSAPSSYLEPELTAKPLHS